MYVQSRNGKWIREPHWSVVQGISQDLGIAVSAAWRHTSEFRRICCSGPQSTTAATNRLCTTMLDRQRHVAARGMVVLPSEHPNQQRRRVVACPPYAQTPLIRFVVDLLYNLLYNKSTTQSLNAAVFEKVNQLVPSFTLCTTVCNGWLWRSTASLSVIVPSCNFSQPVSSPKASSLACRWRLCRRSVSWCFSTQQQCASIL